MHILWLRVRFRVQGACVSSPALCIFVRHIRVHMYMFQCACALVHACMYVCVQKCACVYACLCVRAYA